MLFTKKNKFEILDSQIKEVLKAPDESVILRLNLRYPEIHCQKKDPLYANAKDLYPRLAKSLEEYGKTELYQKALRAYNSDKEDFLPYALVMRWENTFIDKDYLSILLDISVSYGNDSPSIERKTQVWDRKNGQKCRFADFFPNGDIKLLFPDAPKHFEKELFVLGEGGIEFFLPDGKSHILGR